MVIGNLDCHSEDRIRLPVIHSKILIELLYATGPAVTG